jgi:hypothetical protein
MVRGLLRDFRRSLRKFFLLLDGLGFGKRYGSQEAFAEDLTNH